MGKVGGSPAGKGVSRLANWDDRRYDGEYSPADDLSSSGRYAYREHDAYGAYDAAMPYQEVPYPASNIPVGYESGYPVGYGASSFGELSTNPKVAPLTAQMAVHLGFDPNLANGSVARRAGALLVDSVIYIALIAAIAVLASIVGTSENGVLVMVISLFLGPGGFYLYRVAGDSIFDGSPGKHAMGMKIEGAHGMPVSARDGFVRNAWILPSMIPFAGWFVSAGLAGWIAMGASRDPLGRGRHELSVRTRVVEKPETRELSRGQRHMDQKDNKSRQLKRKTQRKRVQRGK